MDKLMRVVQASTLAFLAALMAVGQSMAQMCQDSETENAFEIQTEGAEYSEVFGAHSFQKSLPNGLIFSLEPQRHGWSIRVYDAQSGLEMSSMTPPLRLATNPREISGWHFRNSDNTGPNEGSVNAPQQNRHFVIAQPGSSLRAPPRGLGWLNILDFGLADLNEGEKARMLYLKFQGCVMMAKTAEPAPAVSGATTVLGYRAEDRETFAKCGLDLKRYGLKARFEPALIGGDFDGDGSLDEAAQIMRRSDGKTGLAICRAGTWLDVVGFEAKASTQLFEPFFVNRLEVWRVVQADHGPFNYIGAPPWPDPDGDVLVLERLEKQMSLLFWRAGQISAQRVYRFVEEDPNQR